MLPEGPESIVIPVTHTTAVVPPCGDAGNHWRPPLCPECPRVWFYEPSQATFKHLLT